MFPMDPDGLRRRADAVAARTDAHETARTAEQTAQIERAQGRLDYMLEQDYLADSVEMWMNDAGIDPSKRHPVRRDGYTQQARARNGAATTTHFTPGRSIEDVNEFERFSSHVVKVGDSLFADDAAGNTECYVEFSVEYGMLPDRVRPRHLATTTLRTARQGAERPRGTTRFGRAIRNAVHGNRAADRVVRGPVLGRTPVQDFGQDYKSGIGIRIFQGPPAEDIIVGTGEDAHFDETGLVPIFSGDAALLSRVDRRQITEPVRVGERLAAGEAGVTEQMLIDATRFAGNVHLPPNAEQNLTRINQFMTQTVAPMGITRASEI